MLSSYLLVLLLEDTKLLSVVVDLYICILILFWKGKKKKIRDLRAKLVRNQDLEDDVLADFDNFLCYTFFFPPQRERILRSS